MASHITSVRYANFKRAVIHALEAFTPLERLVFLLSLTIAAIAVLSLLYRINEHFLVSVPATGGTLREGVVGTPRFVNPLLATSDVDRDLSALVYRGLMRTTADGNVVPDMAAEYSVSPDGLTYTFKLGEHFFQDGTPVTSDDVLFTVASAQNVNLKSTQRVAWEGVLAKAPDEHTVTFTLKQPFAPFLASTTLGILPKHIWSAIPYENWAYSNHNTKKAVGSGPYKVQSIKEKSSGAPAWYDLTAVRAKNSDQPYIEDIRFYFYPNESTLIAAYKSGKVDAVGGIDPVDAAELAQDGDTRILTAPLPRVFGLFFNQNQARIFAEASVRKAVSLAIDREAVVTGVLSGYGAAANGPIPAGSALSGTMQAAPSKANTAAAKALLENAGWHLNADGIYEKGSGKTLQLLSFEISTNDTPELAQAVDLIVADLAEAGIHATAKVYETGSLNQDIIRPRKFQALFFGEVISSQSDVYAFWDSSQRIDPGLNITGYANSSVDRLLEQGLSTLDKTKQANIYQSFEKAIQTDMPAAFVYSPSYIYAVRSKLEGLSIGRVGTPNDRWNSVYEWYIATDKVWQLFITNK